MLARSGLRDVFRTGVGSLGTMPPPESLTGIPIMSPAGTGSDTPREEIIPLATDGAATSVTSTAMPTASPPVQLTHAKDSSSAVCNLLQNLGRSTGQAGIYVGEGLLPVPAKLAEKITRWEFTEMAELLPKFWSPLNPRDTSSIPATAQSGTRRK